MLKVRNPVGRRSKDGYESMNFRAFAEATEILGRKTVKTVSHRAGGSARRVAPQMPVDEGAKRGRKK
jgi:hypothetical protein